MSQYEVKQRNPRFEADCSKILEQKKNTAKLLRLQDQSQMHLENLNKVRRKSSLSNHIK